MWSYILWYSIHCMLDMRIKLRGETGETPVRSRHCKVRLPQQRHARSEWLLCVWTERQRRAMHICIVFFYKYQTYTLILYQLETAEIEERDGKMKTLETMSAKERIVFIFPMAVILINALLFAYCPGYYGMLSIVFTQLSLYPSVYLISGMLLRESKFATKAFFSFGFSFCTLLLCFVNNRIKTIYPVG